MDQFYISVYTSGLTRSSWPLRALDMVAGETPSIWASMRPVTLVRE